MKKFHLNYHNTNMVSDNALDARPYSIFKNVKRIDLTKWVIQEFAKVNEDLINVEPTLEIKVPSNVQFYGLDHFQYTNHTYPFPYDPPHIRVDNPCFVYVTQYKATNMQKRHVLNFEGVDSCFYLYVNKEYVGYSTISHRHVEFDITNFIKKGDNEIRVIVFKWNFNSYLEDQDKIRLSGIFRNVYVLLRKRRYLEDYTITTDFKGDVGYIHFKAPRRVHLKLYKKDVLLYEAIVNSEVTINVDKPILWNAEEPFLYDLEIMYNKEIILEKVGIRRFEVKDGALLLNNQKIKLKGMNRHSFTLNGYAETVEEVIADLKLLKEHNINALRTAHYPPHPLLPFLCDEYGIYLMVEADLESHGSTMASGTYNLKDYSLVSKMPEYYEQIKARNLIAYQSVKNRPSLFSFSLGNEAGWSKALADVTDELHLINPALLIHYETIFHSENKDDYYNNNLNFYSRMYADLAWCENHVQTYKDKPFILCEYTHAMGNSLGDAYDYQKLIEKYDNFAGGFVWEFISQSIRVDGKDLYGGDFGETQHDGNFCVDGVVEIDRTPTPQFNDLKEVFAPVDFYLEDGHLVIKNKYDFKSFKGFKYTIVGVKFNEEKLLKEGVFANLLPGQSLKLLEKSDEYISYRFTLKDDEKIISIKQVVVKYALPETVDTMMDDLKIIDGFVTKLVFGDVTFSNMRIHFYRPPIDNEMLYLEKYEEVGIKDVHLKVIKMTNNSTSFDLVAKDKSLGNLEVIYRFEDNSSITLKANFNHGLTMLSRFGLSFDVDAKDIAYFGYGPGESYIDRHQGTTLGHYKLNVSDNYRYIKPQASGNHYGVYYVMANDILISSDKPFETSLDNIDIYTYPSHRHLLKETKTTTLYLDYKQSGVGSYACGPELLDKYRLNEKEVYFVINFRKIK